MVTEKSNHVLVTGGGTYLGVNIASALLAEGAEVTLLIREGNEKRLGPLATKVRWYVADVWDAASLKGRARGQGTVIHTVGSMVADPAQGLTYKRLNVVSARNVANMCVSDGVGHYVLLSSVYAPWVNRHYVSAKRDAEAYVKRVGLKTSIVRAPLTYVRGTKRPFFYRLMTALGYIPPLSWTLTRRVAPMPLDVFSRGIARIALKPPPQTRHYYARQLRKLNTREELQGKATSMQAFDALLGIENENLPFEMLDEDVPFGWMPPSKNLGE